MDASGNAMAVWYQHDGACYSIYSSRYNAQEGEWGDPELVEENKRLAGRDCNASIELCYSDGENPFARESLKIVDVGVSDNRYVVESKIIENLKTDNDNLAEENKKLREAVTKLMNEYVNRGSIDPQNAEKLLKELEN